MKPLFLFFVFIMTCVALGSCERDNSTKDSLESANDDTSMETTDTFFLADIEGMALNTTAVRISETTIQEVSYIEIVAENISTGQVLRLFVPANAPAGSYPMASQPDPNGVFGTYRPDSTVDSSTFVSTSGLFNLSQKSIVPLSISGNTVFAMVNEQGSVDEVTFCEFVLMDE